MKVEEALRELRAAATWLSENHPDLAADEQAWVDTLDGITNGLDLAEYLAERMLKLEALEQAARQRAGEIEGRARRFAAQQEKLRNLVQALVEAAGGKPVVRPTVTLSLRAVAPKVIEIDASRTPPEYLRQPPATPDRTAIREALKAGKEVDGWTLSNGAKSLSILTR